MAIPLDQFAAFDIENENKDLYSYNNGELNLTLSCGSMWGAGNTAENLFLVNVPGDTFRMECTLDLIPVNVGEQAGLVLYGDNNNYIKHVREFVDAHYVLTARELTDVEPKVLFKEAYEPSTVTLGMDVSPSGITMGWKSEDGAITGKQQIENLLGGFGPLRAGIFCHGQDAQKSVRFSDFSIS